MKKFFSTSLACAALIALAFSAAAQAPSISVDPISQTNTVGNNVTFSVTASGDAPLAYQWQKDNGDISGATDSSYTINSIVTADAANSPGYTVVITNNSGSITSAPATLTVNKADQTITFGTLANKTYGDSSFGISAAASSGLAVTFSIFSGPANITGGTNVNITGAGTVVVRASQAGDADYNAAPDGDQSLVVSNAVLTVTADNASRVYGASNPTFTASYNGFVNGDDEGVLSGNPSLATTANELSGVGNHAIVAALGTLSTANYSLSFVDGVLNITKAPLTVTANNKSRAYGAANPAFSASYSGFVNGETDALLSGAPSFSTTATTNSSVAGSPYAITPSLGSLAADNYDFTAFIDGSLTVTGATLTVTADNKSKTYGDANPTFTANYSGFVNGEDESVLSGSPSLATTADESSGVGSHPITAGGGALSAANYSFSYVNGTLNITKAPLTVTADNKSRSYGAANPTFTASFSGFLNSDTDAVVGGTPDFSTTATTNSSVAGSPYAITPSLGSLMADNYEFTTFFNGNLTVTAASLTVTANNTNRVYGASNPTFTASYSGFVNGENESVLSGSPSLTTGADESSDAGNHTIATTAGTLSAANYAFSFVDGTLAITKASLTVTADNKSRSYGAANPTFTASYSGFVNSDTDAVVGGTPDFSTSATTNSAVAGSPYAITPSLGSLTADNYDFTTFIDGALTVTAVTLTVTADDTTRTYGASNPSFTASYSGFVNGEDASALSGSPSLTTIADELSGVGNHTIFTAVGTLSAANYSFSFVDGTLTVTKLPLTVTADNKSRAFGAANPTFTASFTGFVNSETDAVVGGTADFSTSATTNSSVAGGPYAITPSLGSLMADNYAFTTFVDGSLTVTAATLMVTADDKTKVYGAAIPALTASYQGFVNGEDASVLTGSPDLSTTATTNSAIAGNPYPIIASVGTLSAANYTFAFVDGNLTVTPATITVTANNTNRIYGASNPTFTASYTGFVNGEDESALTGAPSLTTTAGQSSGVGNHTITSAQGTLASDNYLFALVDGTLMITPAPLTVTADNKSKTYGANNPTFTASFTGFVNSETDAVVGGTPDFSTSATTNSSVAESPYTITPSIGSLTADNYAFTTFEDGELTVTAATLTVTADNTNRVYGASNPAFTASYSGFVNGEDVSILSGSPSLTTVADESSSAGNHTIATAAGTLAAANYAFSFADGTLAITKAPLIVTADNKSRVYGAANPTFTASYSGFVNSDTDAVVAGTPDFSTAATTNSSVTGSPFLITPSLGSLMANNYAFTTFVDGQLAINKAPLTVTVTPGLTKIYGEANPALTPLYIGFVNGEDELVLSGSPSLNTAATTNSTVAGSPYTITVTTNTLASDNYEITATAGTLAVTPASLVITSDSTNRVYGAANPTFTGSIVGLQNADDITADYSTTATPTSPLGNYEISQTLNDPSGRLPNYTVTTNNGTLTIGGAFLTITSDSTNRVYGAANPAFTGSIVGLENGDEITATYSVTATTNSFVGGYVISQTLSDPGNKLGNYTVTTNNGSMSVTVAGLTVSANSTNRAVGSTNPIFTGSIVGILNNDNITADYISSADTNSPTGLYDIVPQLIDPDGKLVNYSVTTNLGVLAVDGPPAIVIQPSNLIVGVGSNAVFSVTAAGGSLLYQWRKDGTNLVDAGNISGTTTPNLTLSTLALSDSATGYSVFITNSAGSITSSEVSLAVINPPSIIVAPVSRTNIAGTTATFSVTAGGDEPLHYQWRFNGVNITDEVFTSLSVIGVQESNAGNYTVVITNFVGAITSAPAVLSVHYSLTASAGFGGTVAKSPDESGYAPGSTVTLTATADPGFTFTGWSGDASGLSNPLNVLTDTNKNITANFMGPGGEIIIDNDDPAGRVEFEGFWYTLDFINPHYGVDYRYASPGTNLVTARATYRPEIVRPGNYDVYLFYPQRPILRTTNAQWSVVYNGGNVSLGLDQHTNGGRWFQITSDKPYIAGTHQFVRVSNNTGETETNAFIMADAVKFVYSAVQGTAPTFITHPQSQTLNQTSNVTFTVQASGSGTLAYQWRFNNEPISGATNTSYTRTNLQRTDAGNYSVVVMHTGGSAISSNAVLSVNLPPTITAQPANKNIIAGQPVTFTVVATGTAPFAYQWRFNSNNISGATGSTYSIANAFATNAGYYSVVISNVAAAVTSAEALLTVNPDITKPTISFVSPSVGGKVFNANITMTGAAKDAIGVTGVKYVYAGVTNTATGTTAWSAPLNLTPGTNVVVAWSIDLSGNESLKKTNTFYYNSTNFLTLNIIGSGQVNGLTNGQPLLVGRPYSATAIIGAGTNYVFTNWSGSVFSTNKTLSFMMQSNMVLTANFISNPYSPVAGKYNGLFSEAAGVTHASAGFFTMTLSDNAGYSGRLMVDGNTMSISGKFDTSGQLNRTVSRSKFGKSALSLTLALDWSTTNETIQGTVSDGVWTADLLGDRAIFDATFNPTTNFMGRYTAIIPEPIDAPTDAPGGYGYLLVTNNSAGVVTISQGALADGSVLSHKVPMSKFGQWPLYVPTYKAITRYTNGLIVTTNLNEFRGAIIGWVSFTNNPTRTLGGRVNWVKSAMSPTNVFYPSGFTSEADLIASAYNVPATGTRLLNLEYAPVVLAGGNFLLPSTNTVFIQPNNVVVSVATDEQLKVSFNPQVGLLKGTFVHSDATNKLTSFFGAVLQQQNYGAGAFRGTNESGSVRLGD